MFLTLEKSQFSDISHCLHNGDFKNIEMTYGVCFKMGSYCTCSSFSQVMLNSAK